MVKLLKISEIIFFLCGIISVSARHHRRQKLHNNVSHVQAPGPPFGETPDATKGSINVLLFYGRDHICNGILVDPVWVVLPAHCIGYDFDAFWNRIFYLFHSKHRKGRQIEEFRIGFSPNSNEWNGMTHYEMEYVVIEQSYRNNPDPYKNYALIRMKDRIPINQQNILPINFMRIPYRPALQIIGFQDHTEDRPSREQTFLKMRRYEYETSADYADDIDRLLCYTIKHHGNAYPSIDGAMIVGVEKNKPNQYMLFGMHVMYSKISSWYMKIGKAINFAGEFYYWLQASKFERLPKNIPKDKRFYCCDESTIARFRQNKLPYNNRRYANIENEGKPPTC